MNGKIGDLLLSVGIKIYHKMEKLREKEVKAQESLHWTNKCRCCATKNKRPLVVGICGLNRFSVKSPLQRAGSSLIGATVISGDDIRILSAQRKKKYDKTRPIAENIATMEIFNNGRQCHY